MKGLPLANIMWSPTMENASSGVHSAIHGKEEQGKHKNLTPKMKSIRKALKRTPLSFLVGKEWDSIAELRMQRIKKYEKYERSNIPFFVGFDIAKIAGRVDVEEFIASKT